MKKILKTGIVWIAVFAILILPQIASASSLMEETFGGIFGDESLTTIITRVIGVILGFLGILAVLLILWAGFIWMTAAGDDSKVDKAKKMIYSGVIGIVIIFSAYAIAYFVIKQISTATGATVN
jgi:hypothetical protein